jgi:hypothetical protein
MFGCCDELCLKVMGEKRWAMASCSIDMDHSMFIVIIKLESSKLKALGSKLQGVFFFSFLNAR